MIVITRRECLWSSLAAAAPPPAAAWTREWDQALLQTALAGQDAAFDARESMLARNIGSAYQYHTNLRSTRAHPTRDSLGYALLLLEAGGDERRRRAEAVIERLLGLQEVDPASKWYGLWGWYMEEPAPKMSPADWNWADFNGSLLLLIEIRHGGKLPTGLRTKVREGIRHAAASVRQRNVSMSYTNIAVQGTFVTLAAGQLLKDRELWSYAVERLGRLEAAINATGSFVEYNSPTYAQVTIENLTRIRMTVQDAGVVARSEKIHHLAWRHLGNRWHVPTAQLAGPMSRCYSTDIGKPLWLQKGLGGRLKLATLDEVKAGRAAGSGEIAALDYRCPEDVAPLFLEAGKARQHREIFTPAPAPIRPVEGTTWLQPEFCLGSVNRGDFWVQRRPLLAYWGGPARPARYAQLRFLKDDYDFSSAMFYSVQERNYVLGLVNFRSPGGDKHVSLDPVKDGEFQASRLRLCIDLAGAEAVRLASHVTADLGNARLGFRVIDSRFGEKEGRVSVTQERVSVDLLNEPGPVTVRWKETPAAFVAFALAIGTGDVAVVDAARAERSGELVKLTWKTPAGVLGFTASTAVRPAAEHDRAYAPQG